MVDVCGFPRVQVALSLPQGSSGLSAGQTPRAGIAEAGPAGIGVWAHPAGPGSILWALSSLV